MTSPAIIIAVFAALAALLFACDSSTSTVDRKLRTESQVKLDENAQRILKEREQLKSDCRTNQVLHQKKYQNLFAKKMYWEAASEIRVCAEALESAEQRSLVATAEVNYYKGEIENPKVSAGDRANAVERLIRDYPKEGKKYETTLAKLQSAANRETQAKDSKLKKSKGVHIGMTPEEVVASSWGKPEKINRTTYANSTKEQWVYGSGNYLYFDDGKLSAIQN